jgi:hypothetical protein
LGELELIHSVHFSMNWIEDEDDDENEDDAARA